MLNTLENLFGFVKVFYIPSQIESTEGIFSFRGNNCQTVEMFVKQFTKSVKKYGQDILQEI